MALKGKNPELIEKRFKAFFYGDAGVGKTTAAIQFPKPYLIDTERGAENSQYIEILKQKGGVILQTSDFDDLINEIKELLTVDHPYKTLIIDPLTTIYDDLLEKTIEELKNKSDQKNATGTEFGRHIMAARKRMKHLFKLLLRLDMNVIITSHAKNKYGVNMISLGQTYDCYDKMNYVSDLLCEVQKRGAERVGIVMKSRVQSFIDGETFPFSYDEIANKYGRESLERDALTEKLATVEQVDEMKRLVKLLNIPTETIKKWLDKANSENFAEMNEVAIGRYIKFLQDKLTGETA